MKKFILILSAFLMVGNSLIAQVGKVGINTSTPQAMLHVLDSSVVFSVADASDFPHDPPIEGSGGRMMWYPDKAAFRVGLVTSNQWDKNNIGYFSFASGQNTRASGGISTAMGGGTIASGTTSTALGEATTASGDRSTALGYNNIASGNASTVIGHSSVSSGFASISAGLNSTASGYASIAMGRYNQASGDYSTAFGDSTRAFSAHTTTFGYHTLATGEHSTAMGYLSYTSGDYSTAFGASGTALGQYSCAIGTVIARGAYEIVIGNWNTDYAPISATTWEPADRLFGIGNGTGIGSRSDAMIILKNGNTGIGASTPQRKLHVSNGDSGASFHSGAVIGVEDDTNTYVNIVTPSANESGILFGTPANAAFGGIIYNNDHMTDPNSLYFRANSATRMAIYQNGTAWLQSTLNIGNDGQLRVYDASGTRYVQLNHSSAGNLHMDAIGGGTNYISWYGGSGLHVGNGAAAYGPVNASAFTVSSARRFKKDIVDMHYGLAEILQMQGKEYVYINDPTNHHEIGLIAEEVEQIVPEVVYHGPNDNQVFGIDYGKLTPVLIEAIKEQQNQIDHQTHLIADQQQQIDKLRMLVNKLLAE